MRALKDKYKYIHFSIICSNQKLEISHTHMSINTETDELTVGYLYDKILQSSKMSKLLLHATTNTNKSGNHNCEQRKPDST